MQTQDNDKAPFFKSWGHWYVLTVVFLIVLIVLFSLFTKQFN
ncbi:MAG: hypothetical protein WDN26_09970 [Chitinophagaceae bacterium]